MCICLLSVAAGNTCLFAPGDPSHPRGIGRIKELMESPNLLSPSAIPRLSPRSAPRSPTVEASPPYSNHPTEIPRLAVARSQQPQQVAPEPLRSTKQGTLPHSVQQRRGEGAGRTTWQLVEMYEQLQAFKGGGSVAPQKPQTTRAQGRTNRIQGREDQRAAAELEANCRDRKPLPTGKSVTNQAAGAAGATDKQLLRAPATCTRKAARVQPPSGLITEVRKSPCFVSPLR